MAAEKRHSKHSRPIDGVSGQSILEFLITLPLMLGLAMLMIRVNTYIQMGIVNQQYAREQTLFVAGNGAEYPQRSSVVRDMAAAKFNQLVIGISENPEPEDHDTATPETATTYKIVPASQTGYNDNAQTEALQRGNLRVRSSVTICLPTIVSASGALLRSVAPIQPGQNASPMSDDPGQFKFCSAPQKYDDDEDGIETI